MFAACFALVSPKHRSYSPYKGRSVGPKLPTNDIKNSSSQIIKPFPIFFSPPPKKKKKHFLQSNPSCLASPVAHPKPSHAAPVARPCPPPLGAAVQGLEQQPAAPGAQRWAVWSMLNMLGVWKSGTNGKNTRKTSWILYESIWILCVSYLWCLFPSVLLFVYFGMTAWLRNVPAQGCF